MREKWMEIMVSGFVAGVFSSSFVHISFIAAVCMFALAAGILLYGRIGRISRPILFILPLVLVSYVGGIARYEMSNSHPIVLNQYVNTSITVEGVVSAKPDVRDTLTFLTVDLDTLALHEGRTRLRERVRVGADLFPEFQYSDRIRISGKLQQPESFETSSGRVFDYPSYLAKDNIYYELFRPKITLLHTGGGNRIVAALFHFKQAFMSRVEQLIPEPESALLGGLILGEKHSLGTELMDAFRRAGVVHIIVLSGYNLTIIAYALMRVFSFLPSFLGSAVGALGIVAFTIMTGASATAVRAAIMALLVILAKVTRREYDIKRALFLAAFVMIAENPKIVAFDPSFQLSFLATLGLLYLSPFFEVHLRWVTEKFGLRAIVAATCSTQVFVLPLLVNMSGVVSVVGVLTNILVLPFIPTTMLFGALAGFAGFIHATLAAPFAYITYLFLHYDTSIVRMFGNLPFATATIPTLPLWAILGIYALLWRFVVNLRFKHS